jgi:uncharacterized protein YdaU (DUF1376 family)
MAKFPALPLWTDAWIADTHHLSRCERGIYLDLLILMWRSPQCRISNDDIWLAKRMHMTQSEIAKLLRPLIKEFCHSDGNWLWQKRLLREFRYCNDQSLKQSVRAKARWRKEKNYARAYAASGIASSGIAPTPTPTPLRMDSKKEKAHFKNGNGSKRIEKQKPKHCQRSKNGRIWCDVGTMEFTAYAEDYSQAHLGEAPKLDWNGSGAWFNLNGETL